MDRIVKNDDVSASNLPDGQQVIDFREVGATGLRRFSGFIYDEFLPELIGWKGAAVYKEMAHNDPVIVATLFAIKMLCRRAKWFVDPPSDRPEDKEAGAFLESCMNDMSMTWNDIINEALSMLDYGYSVHELVYKRRCGDVFNPSLRSKYNDGRVGWRKISIRSQDTIYRWQFDDHGGIQGVEQLAPPHYYHIIIPVEKMLLFRTTVEKNNPEGLSILRGAYRSWFFKKNIENLEGIGIERDLAGLPMAFVPPEILSANASQGQKALLGAIKNLTINVRRNEQEGMVFPMEFDANGKPLYDFKLLSTGGSRQFDTNAIINRWDHRIAMTTLADFMLMEQNAVGSFALATTKTNLFSTSIGAFLDMIADVFNRYAIPRLFSMNDYDISDYPQIKHGDIGAADLDVLGNYILKLSQAGMPLFPNPEIEKHFLDIAGIPSAAIDVQTDEHLEIENVQPEIESVEPDAQEIPGSPVQTPTPGTMAPRYPADDYDDIVPISVNS